MALFLLFWCFFISVEQYVLIYTSLAEIRVLY